MVATLPERRRPPSPTRPALIDCDFHNELDSTEGPLPVPARSAGVDHIETFGMRGPAGGYYPRFLDHRDGRLAALGPAGRLRGGLRREQTSSIRTTSPTRS